MNRFRAVGCLLGALLTSASAFASDAVTLPEPTPARFGFGNYAQYMEARFGVLSYDTGLFSHKDTSSVTLNGEFLLRSPEFFSGIGAPRPYVGANVSFGSNTVDFFYAGLNWDYNLTNRLYLSGSVGGSVNTADKLDGSQGEKPLGCRALFHLGAAVGFDVTEQWTVQAYADHFSNANLCDRNAGLEDVGVRVGYRF